MFFLELSLGQYLSVGGLGVWKLCPAFKGTPTRISLVCITVGLLLYYGRCSQSVTVDRELVARSF